MNRLLPYISEQAWAMEETRLLSLAQIVQRRATGVRLSRGEVGGIVKPKASAFTAEVGDRGYARRDSVAVIPVGGTISKYASMVQMVSAGRGASITSLRRAFASAQADDTVRSILLLIDSPGGSVSGVETFAQDIAAARKAGVPVFAYADDLAASAAYWIGAQAQEFIGNRTAGVGSIGVYSLIYDTSKLYETAGVKVHLISAGKFKASGADGPPVSEEALAAIQAEINAYYAAFKEAVVRGRQSLTKKQVDELADGRVHIGPDAVKLGLLDSISPVEAVLDRMNRKFGSRVKRGVAAHTTRSVAMNDELNVGGGGADTGAGANQPSPGITAERIAEIAGEAAAKAVSTVMEAKSKADAHRRDTILASVSGFEHIPEVKTLKDRALADANIPLADVTRGVLDAAKKGLAATGNIEVGEDGRSREIRGIESVLLGRAMPALVETMRKGDATAGRIAEYFGAEKPGDFVNTYREAERSGLRRMRLLDVAERCARPGAVPGRKAFRSDDDVIRASFAHTSSDFPELLSAVANKVLLASFALQPVTYDRWCAIGNARDFKEQPLITLSDFPDLLRIPEGSPAQEASMKERREKIKPDTYGRRMSMTRRMLIDDDLDAFAQLPAAFGAASARVPEDLSYLVLTTNPTLLADNTALFHANHRNLGAAAALSVPAIETAYAQFRKQRGFGTNKPFLDLRPAVLIVPVALRATAEKCRTSDKDFSVAGAEAPPNTVKNLFTVVDNPRLDDSSATAWYLVADPGIYRAVQINFLDGKREPTITEVGDGSILGVTFEIIFDCGAAAVSHEAAYKNPGA